MWFLWAKGEISGGSRWSSREQYKATTANSITSCHMEQTNLSTSWVPTRHKKAISTVFGVHHTTFFFYLSHQDFPSTKYRVERKLFSSCIPSDNIYCHLFGQSSLKIFLIRWKIQGWDREQEKEFIRGHRI